MADGIGFQGTATAAAGSGTTGRTLPPVEVVSDAICPWCFVAAARLPAALALLGADGAPVTWRPYELNPGMPREGVERRAYRVAKFGSWEASLRLDAGVAAAAREDGTVIRHDLMTRTPNTVDAHRLAWLALAWGGPAAQDAVARALFAAYFAEGRDVGDRAVLLDLGAAAGLDRDRLAAALDSGEGEAEVRAEAEAWRARGVSGVPTVLVGGVFAFSGALRPEAMAERLAAAAALAGTAGDERGRG